MPAPMQVLLVPADLAQALLDYLNSRPRGEVNALATALENCQPVTVQAQGETEKADPQPEGA